MGIKKLTEKRLRNLIRESINTYLNEDYTRSFVEYISPQEIQDNIVRRLANLVSNFTSNSIDYNYEKSDISNMDEFIEGIIMIYSLSEDKVEYDEMKLRNLYQEYVNKGDENGFWEDENVESLDGYDILDAGYLTNPNFWNMLPSPNELKEMIEHFKEWYKNYTEFKVDVYQREKWTEYKVYKNQLDKKIY